MEEQRFDDLSRLIATKTSRRQVLKVLAGAALGGMFANRLSPAWAAGNSTCAHFCTMVFGEDTLAQSQCASDAAHHKGLCYSACGPGGSGTLCGGPDYSSTVCCSGSTPTCSSGTCTGTCEIATCGTDPCNCPTGTVAITNSNGTTCVKPCSGPSDCLSGTCGGTFNDFNYCTSLVRSGYTCSIGGAGIGDAACPTGTFCSPFVHDVNHGGELACLNAAC